MPNKKLPAIIFFIIVIVCTRYSAISQTKVMMTETVNNADSVKGIVIRQTACFKVNPGQEHYRDAITKFFE